MKKVDFLIVLIEECLNPQTPTDVRQYLVSKVKQIMSESPDLITAMTTPLKRQMLYDVVMEDEDAEWFNSIKGGEYFKASMLWIKLDREEKKLEFLLSKVEAFNNSMIAEFPPVPDLVLVRDLNKFLKDTELLLNFEQQDLVGEFLSYHQNRCGIELNQEALKLINSAKLELLGHE